MKSNIIKLIIALALAVATGVTAYIGGYNKGYDEGWNRGADDVEHAMVLNDIIEPRTDSEIWEKYHDCDMYGLPEYARQECGK